jgi:hypothetical protein
VFSLGFYRVGWESREWDVIDPTIGWLEAEEFDPAGWKPNWPNRAFQLATDRDGYWGAKLVGSFTDEQIRAAVSAGRLPVRRAADTLAKILMVRRDRVVDHWYRKVSPLESFSVVSPPASAEDGAVSPVTIEFEDLGYRMGLWNEDEVVYRWRFEHEKLGRDWRGESPARAGSGNQRIVLTAGDRKPGRRPSEAAPTGVDALAKLEIQVEQRTSGERQPNATVWLEWLAPLQRYRVVGLEH